MSTSYQFHSVTLPVDMMFEGGVGMRVLDMLRQLVPEFEPSKTKIHLASEGSAPFKLDVFASGGFPEWQRYQTQRNFEHPFVVALIKLAERDRAKPFRFSILEIADIHTGEADVIAREGHWKRVLLSRSHGLNGN